MADVQPKHRKFAREVAKGRTPESVIQDLYPNEDVAVALRRVQTPKVLALLESLVAARWERAVVLSRLSAIVADKTTKQSERITALRLGAQVSGYLNNMAAYKPSRKQLNLEERPIPEALRRRIEAAELET